MLVIDNLLLNWFACVDRITQFVCLRIATALLVVCRWRRPSECHANYKVVWNGMVVDSAHKIGCHGNILRGIEKITRSFIYGQSSTNSS